MKLLKRMKLNSKGFSHVEAVIAILVIAGIAVVGVRVIGGSHAAPLPSTTSSTATTNWQDLVTGVNKETEVNIYACVQKTSSTQWWIKAKGTLSPMVSDSSKYTVATIVGTTGKGGASSSNTWTKAGVTTFKTGFNPTTQSPSIWSVTPSITYPANDSPIKGGGGGAVLISNLNKC